MPQRDDIPLRKQQKQVEIWKVWVDNIQITFYRSPAKWSDDVTQHAQAALR